MKRFACCFLTLCLLCGCLPAFSEALPAHFDAELAQRLLLVSELCYDVPRQEAALGLLGYTKLGAFNYDREAEDSRHVAAYTVYEKRQEGQTEVLIAVRGTGEGEWPLNVELMPGGNYDLDYAENFYLAARDILDTHGEYLRGLEEPLLYVTGHSRGAAVANMLGAELTDGFGPERVRAYTFATPRTVRGQEKAYANIFNVINPADVVTYLPLPQWGFERWGVDIVLPAEDGALAEAAEAAYALRSDKMGEFFYSAGLAGGVRGFIDALAEAMPTVAEAFTVRHALLHPGAAMGKEPGMTGGELLLMMSGSLLGGQSEENGSAGLRGVKNDFTPILAALMALQESGEAAHMGMAHMPAMYGAWMTVMAQ